MNGSFGTLTLEVDETQIALVTIDVPGRMMNVLTPALIADLATAVEQIAADPAVKGAIISSGKDNGFLAGADLNDLLSQSDHGISAQSAALISRELSSVFRRLETCGKPMVAAINGLALGGGFELCLACHHRVLSEDTKAVVGFPEVTVGLLPAAGGTQRTPRLIGIPAALPLLLEGRHVPPAQALTLGLVHAIAPKEGVMACARSWLLEKPQAQQPWDVKGYTVPGGVGPLASHAWQSFVAGTAGVSGGGGRNYPSPLAILSCVFEGTQVAFDVGLRIESKYFGKLLAGPVARNLIRTLFLNKGSAEKLRSRPTGPAKTRASKVGVVGAGLMGAGIAHVSAKAGIDVVLIDTTLVKAEQGKAGIAAMQNKDLQRGVTTLERVESLLARISAKDHYSNLSDADLIVEAVFEDRDIKESVIKGTEPMIPEAAVFASNTSTLPITGLAAVAHRPQNFIGLHFFSPVEKMPLVEVIVGANTSESTLARALDYVGQLRKTPVVVHDSPGFYTSRVFTTFVQEGLKMLEEGVAPALIENAAKMADFPIGPLAVSDEVSLSLQQRILKQQQLDCIPERLRIRTGEAVINKMVDVLSRPGRREGGGFYEYPATGAKYLWPALTEAFPQAARQPDISEIQRRLLVIMALESVRCVAENIISPADADIASILGIGYPSWTGGTYTFIQSAGAPHFVAEARALEQQHGTRFAVSPEISALLLRTGAT